MTPQELADDLSIDVRELRQWLRANHPRPRDAKGRPWRITSTIERDARVAFGQPPSLRTDLKQLKDDVTRDLTELSSEVGDTMRGVAAEARQALRETIDGLRSETAD